MRIQSRSLELLSELRIWYCCKLQQGHRCGSDPVLLLLWLWRKPAGPALIQPLAWELQYAAGVAQKKQKKKKKKLNQPYIPAVIPICHTIFFFKCNIGLCLLIWEFLHWYSYPWDSFVVFFLWLIFVSFFSSLNDLGIFLLFLYLKI